MAPKTSVRSIRLSNEAWAWLAAEAERRKLTANALVAETLELLRRPPPTRPQSVAPSASMVRRPTAKEIMEEGPIGPALPLGPVRPKPGAMLIEKKRKR